MSGTWATTACWESEGRGGENNKNRNKNNNEFLVNRSSGRWSLVGWKTGRRGSLFLRSGFFFRGFLPSSVRPVSVPPGALTPPCCSPPRGPAPSSSDGSCGSTAGGTLGEGRADGKWENVEIKQLSISLNTANSRTSRKEGSKWERHVRLQALLRKTTEEDWEEEATASCGLRFHWHWKIFSHQKQERIWAEQKWVTRFGWWSNKWSLVAGQ